MLAFLGSKKTSLAGVWDDPTASKCTICAAGFTLFFRKHHCRVCGKVVCAPCSKARQRLQSSRTGRLKRVCATCVASGALEAGRADSEEEGGGGGGGRAASAAPLVIDLVAGTGRATAADQRGADGSLPVTAAAVIESVRDKRGFYNWALFEATPEPPLLLVNAGTLSVAECRRYLLPDKTYCGLLRFAFGQGRERRAKIVFLAFTGAQAGVAMRTKFGNAKPYMKEALGTSSLDVQATHPLELDVESIVDKLKKIVGSGVAVEEGGGVGEGAGARAGAGGGGSGGGGSGRQASSAKLGEGEINVRSRRRARRPCVSPAYSHTRTHTLSPPARPHPYQFFSFPRFCLRWRRKSRLPAACLKRMRRT